MYWYMYMWLSAGAAGVAGASGAACAGAANGAGARGRGVRAGRRVRARHARHGAGRLALPLGQESVAPTWCFWRQLNSLLNAIF